MSTTSNVPRMPAIAALCRRNAVHVLRLAWPTHPHVAFDRAGVLWLADYIDDSTAGLSDELRDEFVQLMGCFYGECLIAEFDGEWAYSGDELGVHVERLGFTYPFTAVARQMNEGGAASLALAFLTAVEYLRSAA